MINSFEDQYEFLSNFYPCKIYYNGRPFPTVEHAYQASKTFNFKTIDLISNLKPNEAGKAKRIGDNPKYTPLRQGWNCYRLIIMEFLLAQKFNYKSLKERLIRTGDQQLVEGNYWHDNFWGDCFCKKCKSKAGENNLGKLLMHLRSYL